MNELERELARRLEDAAPPARSDALDRAMARIAETPQRSGWRVRLAAGRAPATWSRVGAFVVVAATALVIGIAIGQSGLPFGGRSPSPSAMADGSASPAPTSSAPAGWVEPQDYAFTFLSSCGERSLLGRFRVTVVDGVVASFEPLDEQAQRFLGGIADIPTLARMMELAAEAEGRAGARVQVSFDPADGHPVEVDIDWDTDAMDDEECYLVSDYAPASAPTSAPVAFADWERLDLPDPAPDVFGGGTPKAIVRFGDGYVAAGTVSVSCCADGDLSQNRGVIWTSPDGRNWEVHDPVAGLEHAMVDHLVTDGERLLAVGRYADPAIDETGFAEPALWASTDAITWTPVESERIPSVVQATDSGFIGVDIGSTLSTGQPFSVFMSSADGLRWDVRSENWGGGAADLTGPPEGPYVAVGTEVAFWPGMADLAYVWLSDDGTSWPRPITVERGARMVSVAYSQGRFVVVGHVAGQFDLRPNSDEDLDREELEYRSAIWTSTDGRSWERRYVAESEAEVLREVHAVGEVFVVTGDSFAGDAANAAVLVSLDGATWSPLPDGDAFGGINNEVLDMVEVPDGLLAVGRRWDAESSHPVPVTWAATR